MLKMQHYLKLGLIVDVHMQGISKITMICRAGPRGPGQRDTQVDVIRFLKL